jgi:hypothetical protein
LENNGRIRNFVFHSLLKSVNRFVKSQSIE